MILAWPGWWRAGSLSWQRQCQQQQQPSGDEVAHGGIVAGTGCWRRFHNKKPPPIGEGFPIQLI
ncbi:hypothetical protein SynA18461_02517 [Synechococcus sp. A18-46.1]|nr:hypothetical protein SynA18461_02517 [Synechococcus sp. A18-46.1]